MKIKFAKYHGAGNDFILLNELNNPVLESAMIKTICDRHLGIGADGLILIKKNSTADFQMIYYNADGNLGSMCGNGARCAAVFAQEQGLTQSNITNFKASDGSHTAKIFPDGSVKVSMSDVKAWKFADSDLIIDTGSPHYVKYVSGLNNFDVVAEGKKIRYSNEYNEQGINVNFVEDELGQLKVRTYERGVENETLACGTGTVAVAISTRFKNGQPMDGKFEVAIKALGGDLIVIGEFAKTLFRNIYLTGPVQKVFESSIEVL